MSTKEKKRRQEQQDTVMQKIREEAIEALEDLGGKAFRAEDVIFQGDKLILPEGSTMGEMVKFLQGKIQEDSEETNFTRTFGYRPWDVAWCTFNSIRRFAGSISHTKGQEMGFFGPMETPPTFITIHTGPGKTEEVPWGGFRVPFLPKVQFYLDNAGDPMKGPLGMVRATAAKKWQHAIEGVFNLIEKELRENSLYKGKVFDGQQIPQFVDLSSVDPGKIVFAQDTQMQLEANLWAALRHREAAARAGLPFKRAILLTGDFGVGKTLAINRTLQIAEQEGITGILVRSGRDDLWQAMNTARLYQPAIVAFEDVEVIADAEQEDRTISQILDMFDGIEAKNSKVMLVLTSNHAERLHRGMLRPGRLDAVVKIGTPDREGIRKLVEVTIPDGLDQNIDWNKVGESMESYLPAFVVEAAQRSVRYSLARNDGVLAGTITEDDLIYSGTGLREQYEMMQEAQDRSANGSQLERAMLDIQYKSIIEREGMAPEPGESPLQTLQRHGY